MAGGWLRDGAVQDQIDADVEEAVDKARRALGSGKSATNCAQCGKPIPEARRNAVPGVRFCIECQLAMEEDAP